MGSASSSDKSSPSDLRPVYVADKQDDYPDPRPTTQSKSEIFKEGDYENVDNHAKSTPNSVCSEYSNLLDYLFEDLKTDLQMVRAIFTWMGSLKVGSLRLGHVKDSETPAGYMKLIQKQQGSYAAFFTLLCRHAKIPCVVVRGTGKAVGYEVGDENVSDLKSKWVSVYVAGQWRLIHPLWAFTGVKGHKSGKWTLIEKKGDGRREKEGEYEGSEVNTTNEFFFLTDPDQFILLCRAKEEPWQLLRDPVSEADFIKSPFVTPEYFSNGLKLVSHDTCDLIAHEGKEAIKFEHPKGKNPSLSYELYCDEDGSDEKLPDSVDLERHVLENTQKTTKGLFLRFPVAGLYKLRVFGGEGKNPPHICDFRIRCDERAKNPNPFPLQKDIGYGYVQDAKDAGLVTTSAYSGIVVLEHGQKMTFNFDVDRPVEFETRLHHRDKSCDELEKYVEKEVSNKNAEITVTMPEKGLTKDSEYALEINTREEDKREPYKNVCNYFLTPDKKQWKDDSDAMPNNKAVVRPVGRGGRNQTKEQPRARRSESPRDRMRAATTGESIDELERTINDFEKSELKEKNTDLTKAKERLVQLRNDANKDETPRERMREATKGESIEELEKSIEGFEDSGLDEKDEDLTEARRRLAELKAKDKIRKKMREETYGDDIDELEKSIDEFERGRLDERDNDYTEAKRRLANLKGMRGDKEKIRQKMRDETYRDDIDELERSIEDFEKAGLDERDNDYTEAKGRLADLKKRQGDEVIRQRMRDATRVDSIEDLENAIADFEKCDLDEKDEDLTRAKERLAQLKGTDKKDDTPQTKEDDKPDEVIRQRMRDATDKDSIEDLEKAIDDFERSDLDEKDEDLTLAKARLAKLKNDAYQEPEKEDESAREAMRDATDYGSKEQLEKAIKDFEDSGLDEKDRDLTKAREKLAQLNAKNRPDDDEEQRLRKRLQDSLDGDDLDEIEKALGACKDAGLSDKGDISEAERRLLAKYKEKLEEARKGRDAEKLQKALEEAEQSAVADKLDDEEDYQEAKEANEQIHRVRKFNQQVLELNPRLVSEIASYKRPKPCIQDVMRGTYIILGDEDSGGNWQAIVKKMKSIGQGNVIRRVGQFDIVGVEPAQAKQANKLISKWDLDDVQRNSRGAGVFYTWTRNVIDEVMGGGDNK